MNAVLYAGATTVGLIALVAVALIIGAARYERATSDEVDQ